MPIAKETPLEQPGTYHISGWGKARQPDAAKNLWLFGSNSSRDLTPTPVWTGQPPYPSMPERHDRAILASRQAMVLSYRHRRASFRRCWFFAAALGRGGGGQL